MPDLFVRSYYNVNLQIFIIFSLNFNKFLFGFFLEINYAQIYDSYLSLVAEKASWSRGTMLKNGKLTNCKIRMIYFAVATQTQIH